MTGKCTDSFDVTSGSSRLYYTLCGTLSNQHSKIFIYPSFDMNYVSCVVALPCSLRGNWTSNVRSDFVLHSRHNIIHSGNMAHKSQPGELLE